MKCCRISNTLNDTKTSSPPSNNRSSKINGMISVSLCLGTIPCNNKDLFLSSRSRSTELTTWAEASPPRENNPQITRNSIFLIPIPEYS